jgi:hypothetical protein
MSLAKKLNFTNHVYFFLFIGCVIPYQKVKGAGLVEPLFLLRNSLNDLQQLYADMVAGKYVL